MKRIPLIVIGAGGFAREVYCWAMDSEIGYDIQAFYSDDLKAPDKIYGVPVFHTLDHFEPMEFEFIVAVGDPTTRQMLYEMAEAKGFRPCAPIIHPTATIGNMVSVGPGSILCPNSVITVDCKIGKGFILNLNATVGHDCKFGDFVTVSPGANVSGNVETGHRAYIGTGSSVREKIKLGHDAVLGAGSALVKDMPDLGIWGGVPAGQLKKK